jgi:hypothetical protein
MMTKNQHEFVVIHPLDDKREHKVDLARLGPMPMTRVVRWSLVALRAYLILMVLLVVYHVAGLAGILGAHN